MISRYLCFLQSSSNNGTIKSTNLSSTNTLRDNCFFGVQLQQKPDCSFTASRVFASFYSCRTKQDT